MIFNDADSVYAYLDRYLNFERKVKATEYRLDRMESLQRLFDYPDRAYRVVHVAGSKGKGSTATMLASIMKAAGKRVGLYTSPHLLSFTERIAIDGEPVTNDILLACAEELSSVMEHRTEDDFPGGESPTYFELLTMLGFLCFRKAGCSDAVIEVGLGGRLDSTNV
ncbi:MAG: bifunctional folylpolyglutamate synthase/dihydrofolate synthase, partial [Spirochaetia bacterium]|nr:bifunctional folylpolyglutamate synthase/dihydrofolate synthase [Spirochaetia bacterium]